MRLLILGGSFNPIHIGHLILAEEASFALGYTHVALVPASLRPLKDLTSDPGPEARLEMVQAAALGDPGLIVWDGEVLRGGLSYSIDTVREMTRRFDLEERPGFLVGDDLLSTFSQWREADALAREARIICARRGHAERLSFPYEHDYLDNLLIPISSQIIRDHIRKGTPYRRLVPDAVWSLIESRGYYRHG